MLFSKKGKFNRNRPVNKNFKAQNQRLRNILSSNRRPAIIRQPRMSGAMAKFTKRAGPGEEIKTLDLLFTGAAAAGYTPDTVPLQQLNMSTNTTSVQALNLVQQGPGTSQRIGHKISMKSARLRLTISSNGNTNASIQNGRVLVVYDHNPDGAYVATNQILSNITQANVVQNGIFTDSLNPNFYERMVVLMDKFITLPPFETGAINTTDLTGVTSESSFHIDEFVKLKDLETIYGNTANGLATANPMTIAYIQTGALYIIGYGDTAAGGSPWALNGSVRLRFRDN